MSKLYTNNRSLIAILLLVALCVTVKAEKPVAIPGYQQKIVQGWNVYISDRLLREHKAVVTAAMPLLEKQLVEIIRVVPGPAVEKLKETFIFFTLPAHGEKGTAEYHDDAGWLRDNGRDPAMAKGVQVSDVADFAKETDRMPAFILHELAHSYHDKVLKWEQPAIVAAYEHAKAAKLYDRVECWHGTGTPKTFQRAYAMTDHKEYFAELTESFFVRNDFFPFNRAELEKHDPEAFAVLKMVWGVE